MLLKFKDSHSTNRLIERFGDVERKDQHCTGLHDVYVQCVNVYVYVYVLRMCMWVCICTLCWCADVEVDGDLEVYARIYIKFPNRMTTYTRVCTGLLHFTGSGT